MTTTADHTHSRRPLLGIRSQPGRAALLLMRVPRVLYHHGYGRLLGHTFLLITHVGRKTGTPHETVAMTATYDAVSREVIVCSAWGANTQWLRNLRAQPAARITIGRDSYAPEQRFLSEDESVAAVREFRRRHPWRLRLIALILDWGELGTDEAVRTFVRGRPFVAFRPRPSAADAT